MKKECQDCIFSCVLLLHACFQSVENVFHQLGHLFDFLCVWSESSAASSHGVRCLSSEHAVIAKEQTAQAIANTAHAYEKSGVEAALSEVRL